MAGLEAEEQPATQLRASRIEKDSRQRDVLINAITESCDPFSSPATTSTCLLNIATGKAATQETQEYLTGSLVAGHELRVKFQEECAAEKSKILEAHPKKESGQFCTGKLKEEASHYQGKICS